MGFKLRTFGLGSDRSTKLATTCIFFKVIIKCIGFNTMMLKGDSGDSSVIAKYLVPGKSIAWESNP